jgi:hypothetical protein
LAGFWTDAIADRSRQVGEAAAQVLTNGAALRGGRRRKGKEKGKSKRQVSAFHGVVSE